MRAARTTFHAVKSDMLASVTAATVRVAAGPSLFNPSGNQMHPSPALHLDDNVPASLTLPNQHATRPLQPVPSTTPLPHSVTPMQVSTRLRANIDVADLLAPPIPGCDVETADADFHAHEIEASWPPDDPVHLALLRFDEAEYLINLCVFYSLNVPSSA